MGIKLGIHYTHDHGPMVTIMDMGATYRIESSLTGTHQYDVYTFGYDDEGKEVDKLWIDNSTTKNKSMTIPSLLTLGVGIGRELNWYLGIEYEFEQMEGVFENQDYKNRHK